MNPQLATLKAKAKAEGWAQYIRTENDERALLDGCYVDVRLGRHACNFFPKFLRHSKGEWAGKPFDLTPVQRDEIVMPIFSWVREDGTRRFRTADVWVPKKNFKSTLAAGLGLYGLLADGENGAEVYAAAVDRKQAGIVHGEAANMVSASPALRSQVEVIRSTKTIMHRGHTSWFRALSADFKTHEGLNAHFVIVDEIHAFDEAGRRLFETLRYSGIARRQPLIIVISTAGDDDTSVGYQQYEYAKAVLQGHIKDTSAFVYIAEAGPDDDWTSSAVWKKANPSLGTIIREEEMRAECEKAIQSPRLQSSFKRYRLNCWVRTSNPWLDMVRWKECGGPVDANALAGNACSGGLDVSTVRDLSAFVLAFRSEGTANEAPGVTATTDESNSNAIYTLLPFFWLPEDGIVEKERQDRVPYRQWVEEGYLTLTPGRTIDYAFIEQRIVELSKRFQIQQIAYDPFNATDLCGRLQERHGQTMVETRQGYMSLSAPSKTFEALVLSGRLRHGEHPILRWQASHVSVMTDPTGNIKPVKPDRNRGTKRIDGIVAAIMAVGRETLRQEATSVYETRGVREVVFRGW